MDFVDVDVNHDTRLFVDPSAIRVGHRSKDPWCTAAYGSLVGFFDELLHRIAQPSLHGAGRAMLVEFHEPRETRLGMSADGYDGSGASDEIGERIWDAVRTNPLCLMDVPILRRIEHLPLYVNDISNDRVSDLTSRIIFEDLVDFTLDQMTKHPSITAGPVREYQVWDKAAGQWDTRPVALPDAGTSKVEPLLLVPKRAVYHSLRMNPRGFWNVPILGAVQDSETVVLSNNKVRKPTKKKLKQRPDLSEIRPTNQQWTELMAHQQHRNLVQEYESYIDGGFDPMDDDEIKRRIAR